MSEPSNGGAFNPVSPLLNNESSEASAEVQRDGGEEEGCGRARRDVAPQPGCRRARRDVALHPQDEEEMHVPPPEQKDEETTCQPCGGEWGTRSVQIKRGPKEPTEEERKKHDACHVPFRSWCSHCVMAAAKASPHRRDADEEADAVPHHHVDYWFMRDCKGAESTPVVVIKDSDTKAFGAHACLAKGNIDWVAERLCEDVENFGHVGKIVLKSDQESALLDLVGEVKKKRGNKNMETLLEN